MQDDPFPTLASERTVVRPGRAEDVPALHAMQSASSVSRWWGQPDPPEEIERHLLDRENGRFVIEISGEVAGEIHWHEENDPQFRHARIDIYVGDRWQNRGLGTEALRLVVRYLFEQRGHHRLTIDPAAGNERAIASYIKVGFRTVGVMRQYDKAPDGSWRDGLLMDLLREEFLD